MRRTTQTRESLEKQLKKIGQTVVARRPYDDDRLIGYYESDNDYFANNSEAAVKLLDLAYKFARIK